MRWIFLAPFVVLSIFCFGQVPDYVPVDGLEAWYSMAGNSEDDSGNGNHLIADGEVNWQEFEGSQFCDFPGEGQFLYHPDYTWPSTPELSIALWVRMDQFSTGSNLGTIRPILSKHYSSSNGSFILLSREEEFVFAHQFEVPNSLDLSQWHHIAVCWGSSGLAQAYFDGLQVFEGIQELNLTAHPFLVGGWLPCGFTSYSNCDAGLSFDGGVYDLGLWNRALGVEEILALYEKTPTVFGCTNPSACNFNVDATQDDGSCTYPGCLDSLACNYDLLAGCDSGNCAFIDAPALPDTISFCDSAFVELDSIYDFVLWSTGDTTTSLVVSESTELGLTVGTGQFCLSDMGFQELYSSDSTTFWLSPEAANWALANSEAHVVGGHLATFASTAEMSAVCSSLGGVHAIFGLYQDENSDDYAEPTGGWNWVTGEPYLWNAWDNNQPNNWSGTYESEEVGHLRPNCHWNDVSEEFDGYQFIVETPFIDCGCTYSTSVVMIRLQDGCLDPMACNFDPQAECDNGSCDYTCCPGPGCCDTGTTWDYEIEKCVPINSCPEDLNYDGIIGVEDLLTLLSSFGTPCDPPVDPPVAEWTCGDPVSYHGYDYETVLIGEQCWFAENLRSLMYRNGDEIPLPISDEEWTMLEDTGDGGMAYPNESVGAFNEFGALYNWNAVIDNRQLCPQGWHIPSHLEWGQMETYAGMEFSESLEWQYDYGNVGDAIKSAEWNCPAWNGQNAFGFSVLPAGYRANGGYDSFGSIGYLWSSSSLADLDWSSQEDHGVFRFVTETGSYWFYDTLASGSNIGISVRCIQD